MSKLCFNIISFFKNNIKVSYLIFRKKIITRKCKLLNTILIISKKLKQVQYNMVFYKKLLGKLASLKNISLILA